MRIPKSLALLAAVLSSLPSASAQIPTITNSDASMPSTSDNASQSQQGSTQTTPTIYSYYLIFVALILCVAGIAAFLTYKRKKKYGAVMQRTRQNALQRDLSALDPEASRHRRRYWQGRWRSADVRHEEGLNEEGEAPPPYVPKRDEGEVVEVPLRTLAREDVGLKPPDYVEVGGAEGGGGGTSSGDGTGGAAGTGTRNERFA